MTVFCFLYTSIRLCKSAFKTCKIAERETYLKWFIFISISYIFMNSELPLDIKKFEYLMYTSFALRLLTIIPLWYLISIDLFAIPNLIRVLLGMFFAYCIYATSRRKTNWTRWILLIIFVIPTLQILFFVLSSGFSPFISSLRDMYYLASVTAIVCHGVAMYFIFKRESSAWLKSN